MLNFGEADLLLNKMGRLKLKVDDRQIGGVCQINTGEFLAVEK